MTYAWHDLIGNIGVALILCAYLLLQLQRMSATALRYSVLNGIGAALVLVSLSVDFNMSAFVIEAAWLVMSVFGVVAYLRRRSANSTPGETDVA